MSDKHDTVAHIVAGGFGLAVPGCPGCVQPESCPICFAPLTDPLVESYSLVHWNPAAGGNNLVQMFCAEHRPLPAPEWLRRERNRGEPE